MISLPNTVAVTTSFAFTVHFCTLFHVQNVVEIKAFSECSSIRSDEMAERIRKANNDYDDVSDSYPLWPRPTCQLPSVNSCPVVSDNAGNRMSVR